MQDPNRWINCREQLPQEEDGDKEGRVLVWHRMGGAMEMQVEHVGGEYVGHWQRMPGFTDGRWISFVDRGPEREDADAQGCVIAWQSRRGARIVHIGNLVNGIYSRWMPCPGRPGRGPGDGKSPCMGCRKRTGPCHDDCDEYKEYQMKMECRRTVNQSVAARSKGQKRREI